MRIAIREDKKTAQRTKLSYSIDSTPSPLQIDEDAKLNLIISPDEKETVILRRIDLQIPVGDRPSQLTTEKDILARIISNSKEGTKWGLDLNSTSGLIRITPPFIPYPFDPRQKSLQIEFYGFKVNSQIGHCKLTLIEYIVESRITCILLRKLSIPKFNPEFNLSDIKTNNLFIAPGEVVKLSWSYTAPANSKLQLIWEGNIGCSLLLTTLPPEPNKLSQLPVTSNAAYVRFDKKLFYINKANNECILLNLDDSQLAQLDSKLKTNQLAFNQFRYLAQIDLAPISAITNHHHIEKTAWEDMTGRSFVDIALDHTAEFILKAVIPGPIEDIEFQKYATVTVNQPSPLRKLVSNIKITGVEDSKIHPRNCFSFTADSSKVYLPPNYIVDTATGSVIQFNIASDVYLQAMHPTKQQLFIVRKSSAYDISVVNPITGADIHPRWITVKAHTASGETINDNKSTLTAIAVTSHSNATALIATFTYKSDSFSDKFLVVYEINNSTDVPRKSAQMNGINEAGGTVSSLIATSSAIICRIAYNPDTQSNPLCSKLISDGFERFGWQGHKLGERDFSQDSTGSYGIVAMALHPDNSKLYLLLNSAVHGRYLVLVHLVGGLPFTNILAGVIPNFVLDMAEAIAISPDKKLYLLTVSYWKDDLPKMHNIFTYQLEAPMPMMLSTFSRDLPKPEFKSEHIVVEPIISSGSEEIFGVRSASGLGGGPALFVQPISGSSSSVTSSSLFDSSTLNLI